MVQMVGGYGEFATYKRFHEHFQKHGSNCGAASAAAYGAMAKTFLTRPFVVGTLEKTRTNGDVIRYNPNTEEFGVISAAGVVRTYFIPDPAAHGYPTNLAYFYAQS
jgi:filamentous hemagglutinin